MRAFAALLLTALLTTVAETGNAQEQGLTLSLSQPSQFPSYWIGEELHLTGNTLKCSDAETSRKVLEGATVRSDVEKRTEFLQPYFQGKGPLCSVFAPSPHSNAYRVVARFGETIWLDGEPYTITTIAWKENDVYMYNIALLGFVLEVLP